MLGARDIRQGDGEAAFVLRGTSYFLDWVWLAYVRDGVHWRLILYFRIPYHL